MLAPQLSTRIKQVKSDRHLPFVRRQSLLLVSLTLVAAAQMNSEVGANADHYLGALTARRHFSGYVVIARNGKPIFSRGYGMANYEDDAAVTTETKFRIGSMTKQFTAFAVMLLRDRGKLSLSDSVCKYMQPCPKAWQAITIKHLLTHTSGLPNYTTFPDIARLKAMGTTPPALVEEIKQHPLDFTPGEKYAYSNSGYVVLGYVIEKVSGRKYADFMRDDVLIPLGMNDSGYETSLVLQHRARGYVWKDHARWNADHIDMSVANSAGALYSTADDLLRWDAALYRNKLISQKSLEDLFTPFRANAASGWFLDKDAETHAWLVHDGRVNGFACYIARDPADRLLILILSNLENTNLDVAYATLRAIAFGKPYTLPEEYQFVQVAPSVVANYSGIYQLPWGSELFISVQKGKLLIAGKNQPASELEPLSDTKFYLEDEDLVLEFRRARGDKIDTLMFGTFPAKRLQ